MPIARSLRQHGLAFFILVFVLRLGGMLAAIYIRPGLIFLTLLCVPHHHPVHPAQCPSFSFIWSSVTVNLNHSILRLRREDVKHYLLTGHSPLDRVASPFGLYRTGTGPDFDQDVLDEFDDLKTKVADELKMQSLENPCQKPREIIIYLGGTGKEPTSVWRHTPMNRWLLR